MDDEYRLAFLAGWTAALTEAVHQCKATVSDTGHTVQATTNVELVELRNAIKARSGS